MKKTNQSIGRSLWSVLPMVCAAVLMIGCAKSTTTKNTSLGELREGFQTPPKEARPRTWWHWLDGNVTREGITADLEAMHRVGIQEATLFNGGMGYPQGPVEYMSDEWLELLKHAASEAKRLGMELSFHNGPGWSSSGGPWVKPEEAMQTVTWSEQQVEGGRTVCTLLRKPASRRDCYQDIAVLAFPTPKGGDRIRNLDAKTLAHDRFQHHLMPEAREVADSAVIRQEDIVNLTSLMKPGGTLEWEAPEGSWTILRIGFTPTGRNNHPALAGGQGLECDKMSRRGLDAFWAGGIQPIIDRLGSLVGTSLTGSLIDSYEVGCGNWTAGFENEFQARRHYDLTPYLPAMAGYYVEGNDASERFLWDVRQTVGELMAENYFQYFAELCHKHGMRFLTEPYEGPFNSLEVGRWAEVPMGEFWVGRNLYSTTAALAASIARINGTQVVGAESFTAGELEGSHMNHPGLLKAQGDLMWTNGINRFILHTNAHQPWEVGPGFTLGHFGSNFNRHNTWWEQGRAWMDYNARSQFLLQQGEGVEDMLVFIGCSSPNMGTERPDIRQLGLDYDQIGLSDLREMKVKDGLLQTPRGRAYKMLLLPQEERPTVALLQLLKGFAEAGAQIIGQRPDGCQPTLEGYPESDSTYNALVEELWGSEKVKDLSLEEAMKQTGLKPDFEGGRGDNRLRYIHRSTRQAEIYFVSNQQKEYRREKCTFRVEGRVPEKWNAVSGTMERVPAWTEKEGQTEINLAFEPEEAYFIVFRQPEKDDVQYTQLSEELTNNQKEPLPGLEIISAEYGQFLPLGIVDVTEKLQSFVRDGRLSDVTIGNDLSGGDPIFGVLKHALVRYTLNGREQTAYVQENAKLNLPEGGEQGQVAIVNAFYGNVPANFRGTRLPKPADVTAQMKELIEAGQCVVEASQLKVPTAGIVEELSEPKLRLVYKVGGELRDEQYSDDMTIDLSRHKEEPRTIMEDGTPYWITPAAGEATLTRADGTRLQAHVEDVPAPIAVEGSWDVHFNQKWGHEWDQCFPTLISLSEAEEEDVKYFSGTATYTTAFTLPEDYVAKDLQLELQLGHVYVIADVKVNDQELGTVWHEPYNCDITRAVQAGVNTLEVRVTNQWVNRLIGDEHLPLDYKADGPRYAEWPAWMQHPESRTSGRTTYVGHRHWTAQDELLPAGLVGPVVIRPFVKAGFAE